MRAWAEHERSLRAWLLRQLHEQVHADDLLQDVFLKAMRRGKNFCSLENARAWLFEVTRNTLADHLRRRRDSIELPQDLPAEVGEPAAPVETLAGCLPRILSELSPEDREAITRCDLEGMSQAEYATLVGVSLPGAKSRVQRARLRLREQLACSCKLRLDDQGKVSGFTPCSPAKAGND
jgi:RNA polymerase sigma-70 factor (ECF subfamily)